MGTIVDPFYAHRHIDFQKELSHETLAQREEPGIISYKWVTPRMRLWGVAPEAWAIGGGVVFAVALASGAGAVTLIPEAVPETAVSIGGLILAF